MKKLNLILFVLITCFGFNVLAQDSARLEYSEDFKGVHATITDYVEGLYLVDTMRIIRSVHPELRKRGYWFNKKDSAYVDNLDMSFQQLKDLAAKWNVGGKSASDQSPKIIEIYDINDKTATAKLTAAWGIDYFHLAKLDGKWYIMNVLWQSIKD